MKNFKLGLLALCALFTSSHLVLAQTAYKVINNYKIKSTGGWDYISVGPDNNRLYVSHGMQVNILNLTTGDSIGVIDSTKGVHGIAFNKAMNKGFTSNGRANNVTVFDLTTNKVLDTLSAGTNPDAIMWEAFTKTVVTCNGRSKDLSFIDVDKKKIIATVNVGGKPETAVADDKGMLYVNVEDKNEIAAIDLKTFKVVGHYALGGDSPTGLEIDKATNRLFATCDKLLVVVDAATGKVVSTVAIGEGCDGAAFDNATKNIFTSNGSGTLSVIHEDSADKYTLVGNYPSKQSARTIAIDEKSHTIFMPAADFEPQPPAGPDGKRPRAKMIPGSFQVVVMAPSK